MNAGVEQHAIIGASLRFEHVIGEIRSDQRRRTHGEYGKQFPAPCRSLLIWFHVEILSLRKIKMRSLPTHTIGTHNPDVFQYRWKDAASHAPDHPAYRSTARLRTVECAVGWQRRRPEYPDSARSHLDARSPPARVAANGPHCASRHPESPLRQPMSESLAI